MSRTLALRFDAALLVLMWLGALALWPTLPERFPIHFDLAGRADDWTTKSAAGLIVWLLLPAVATATSAGMRWATRAADTNPALWNVPHKREFLALPAERRAPIQALLGDMMARLAPLTTLLLFVLLVFIWFSARGGRVPDATVLAIVLLYTGAALALALRASRRAGAAILEAAAAERRS